MGKLERTCLWLRVTWWGIRDWCLRWVYAQHNARVIVDFERRMASVIYAATGGMMSKAYYTADVMLEVIEQSRRIEWDEGYAEGRKDLSEELGVDDPNPPEPA